MNPLMGALLGTLGGIWITGGLHLDGLADVFDGFGANQPPEKTLEIMKDSRVGTFGVLGLMIDFTLHLIGLYSLQEAPYLLIFIPVCGKLGICFLCYIGKNIKKGLGALWIENIKMQGILWNGLIAFIIGGLLRGPLLALGGIGFTLLIVYTLNKRVHNKLGGITGDILGACQQLVEWGIICYLILFLNHLHRI